MGTTLTQRDWSTLTHTLMDRHDDTCAYTHSAMHPSTATTVVSERRRTHTNDHSDMAGGTQATHTPELTTEMLASPVTHLEIRSAVCTCVVKARRGSGH